MAHLAGAPGGVWGAGATGISGLAGAIGALWLTGGAGLALLTVGGASYLTREKFDTALPGASRKRTKLIETAMNTVTSANAVRLMT